MLIFLFERRKYDDFSPEKEYIVEPTDHFQAQYPLQMATSLVDINKACTCKVTVLNPFPTAESIKQDAVMDGHRCENIAKIMSWPKPKTAKQVKQLVAMGSYYRRYVRDFASLVRPMVELTKKVRNSFGHICDRSFEQLRTALLSADVMCYPLNEAGDFILAVDALDIYIGGILHQMQGDRDRVIAYASRTLNKAEKNYCVTEKEMLAIRYFIEYFRQYLLGMRFRVRSDHQALIWIFRLKEPKGKIARRLEILSRYDFSIEYRPGKKQDHCDALSRCENLRHCECP